jgi:hypothetical protein
LNDQLEKFKKGFGINQQTRIVKLLAQLSHHRFKDAGSIIHFHESLLFMLAYPQSKKLLNQVERILASFPERIGYLKKIDADSGPLDEPEVSGIAGTSVTTNFGYQFTLWLSEQHADESEIDWEGYEQEERIAATLPRVLPLFEEEALVEAHVPFLNYINTAIPKRAKGLTWLMKNFSQLDLNEKHKAELFESLKLFIQFTPVFGSSRTGLKLDVKKIFYHKEPLIRRRDISLEREFAAPALKIEKVSAKRGSEILDIIRTASAVRLRELHGFIWADEKSFLKVDLGRGVIVFLNEVLPANRLPLRAYHSGFIFKNGIPLAYVETMSLFEKIEVGFNLYYTFRDGETAWLYAQLLRIFKQHLGVTVFSVDPYQIGYENEEGIESGAFWFYRKLGFHPVQDEVATIVAREEKKIAKRKDYRTPARILRKIAKSHLLYAYAETGTDQDTIQNQWKDFHIRNIPLAIQKRMSRRFNGDVSMTKEITSKQVSRILNIDPKKLEQTEAFSNFALTLSLVPGFSKWTKKEKKLMTEIIRAKGNGNEAHYIRLMQKHHQLRKALIRIGSNK